MVGALIEPMSNKGMDPGTSPDSEVINSIPEVQIGERHQEDVHHAVLGSSKELNSKLDVTISKRGKNKEKVIIIKNETVGEMEKRLRYLEKTHIFERITTIKAIVNAFY